MESQEKKTSRISHPEIKEAIQRSGYLIEQRLESLFLKFPFHARPNQSYPDPITGKTREIDIEAVYLNRPKLKRGKLDFFLAIECENNQAPIVFFRRPGYKRVARWGNFKYSGLPTYFHKKSPVYFYSLDNLFEKSHLSINEGIEERKQYCSFHKKNENSKWIALHNEEQHSSFMTLVNYVEYQMKQHLDLQKYRVDQRRAEFDLHIYLPVLVLEGELLTASLENGAIELEEVDYVKYEKEFYFDGTSESYKIYVVREKAFQKFLQMVSRDFLKMVSAVEDNQDNLAEATKEIIKKFKELTVPKTFPEFLKTI